MGQELLQVQRAYRVVLDPTPDQAHALARHAGAARAAYNHALAVKVAAHPHRAWTAEVAWATYAPEADPDPHIAYDQARRRIKLSMPGYAQTIKTFMATHEWANEVNRYALSSGCRAADTAWKNWLDSLSGRRRGPRMGYPRFKKLGRARDAFTLYHEVKRPTLRPDGYRRLNLPAKAGGSGPALLRTLRGD